MAHYLCEKCSAIMTAQEPPTQCESCEAPADEAFPFGPVVDDQVTQKPLDNKFDTTSTPIAASPTLELDESDLEPSVPPPIKAVSTVELQDSDIEEAGDPPPMPGVDPKEPAFQPRPGRVAYPIPVPGDEEDAPPHPKLELDEMAAAGLPPAPPTPDVALPSQTKSLDQVRLRRMRKRLLVGGIVVVAGSLVVLGLSLWSTKPSTRLAAVEDRNRDGSTGSAPDAVRAPDLVTQRPDLARPDSARPDSATPDQSVAATPVEPTKPVKPIRPVKPRKPPQDPVGDPLEEAQRHYKEGLGLLLRGQLDQAVATFKKALKRNPNLSLAYRGLGLAHQKKGSRALAKVAFKRYLRLRPRAPDKAAIQKRIEGL